MPQISKGARLWPRKRKGRPTVYIIRDGRFSKSTGFGLGQREEAEEALAAYIASRRPDTQQRNLNQIPVADVLNLYQMDQPPHKPSLATIGYHVANLLGFDWGSLAKVKGSSCRAYTAHRVKQGVSQSTARRELKTLSASINHWHKESPLVAVPKVTLPEEGERRERVLERSEVARMLWACRKRKWKYVARFILLGIYTGTRHAAILRLKWELSLSFGYIDTARGIVFRRGTAERETSKRRPPAQIPQVLLRRIRRWREADLQTFRALPGVHVIHYQGLPIRRIRKAWKTIVSDAGLGPEVTPHVLRHTCATWNLWAGKDIWEVAGIIGADASTVERVYGHHKLETVAQTVARKVA
jgi:integrase